MSNQVELELIGYDGSTVVSGTSRVTGDWRKIHALADTVFNEYVDSSMSGALVGITIKQGTDLTGRITSIKLTSGSVIAYA